MPVAVDEPLVELETDKVTIEVPAPAAGVLRDIAAKDGETVAVGALLGQIKEGAGAPAPSRPPPKPAAGRRYDHTPIDAAANEPREPPKADARRNRRRRRCRSRPRCARSPLKPASIPRRSQGSGKDGRVTKGDMMAAIERAAAAPTPVPQTAAAVQARAPSRPTTPRARSA